MVVTVVSKSCYLFKDGCCGRIRIEEKLNLMNVSPWANDPEVEKQASGRCWCQPKFWVETFSEIQFACSCWLKRSKMIHLTPKSLIWVLENHRSAQCMTCCHFITQGCRSAAPGCCLANLLNKMNQLSNANHSCLRRFPFMWLSKQLKIKT